MADTEVHSEHAGKPDGGGKGRPEKETGQPKPTISEVEKPAAAPKKPEVPKVWYDLSEYVRAEEWTPAFKALHNSAPTLQNQLGLSDAAMKEHDASPRALPASEKDLKKDVLIMAIQAWLVFCITCFFLFWIVTVGTGECGTAHPLNFLFFGYFFVSFFLMIYMFYLGVLRLMRARKQQRDEANRIAMSLCSKDVALAQKRRLKDVNFWCDLLVLFVIIVGTIIADSEVNALPLQKCIDEGLKTVAKGIVPCVAIVLIAMLKYVIFCSPNDYTAMSLEIEHALVGKDRKGWSRWLVSPELRGYWALHAIFTFIPVFGLGWIVSFAIGGKTSDGIIGFPLYVAWAAIITIIDGGAIFVVPIELPKLLKNLVMNATTKMSERNEQKKNQVAPAPARADAANPSPAAAPATDGSNPDAAGSNPGGGNALNEVVPIQNSAQLSGGAFGNEGEGSQVAAADQVPPAQSGVAPTGGGIPPRGSFGSGSLRGWRRWRSRRSSRRGRRGPRTRSCCSRSRRTTTRRTWAGWRSSGSAASSSAGCCSTSAPVARS